MAELYLIRHGRTTWNEQRRIQGQIDVPLDEEGTRQAEVLAQALQTIPFSAVWSSPLARAMQTAAPLAEPRGFEIRQDPRLMERHWGAYQGYSREDAAQAHPALDAELRRDPLASRPPDGESWQDLGARVEASLREIAAHGPGPQAVVCHGGAIAAGLCMLLGIAAWPRVRFRVDNASVSMVELTERGEVVAHFVNRRYPTD